MIFSVLRHKSKDHFECVERQLELGIDAVVDLRVLPVFQKADISELTGLPIRFRRGVKTREWRGTRPGEPYPLLHKEYSTPSGPLTTVVQQSGDWPHGDHVPFLDDYLIPRSRKFLVAGRADLKPLKHLLGPPSSSDIAKFRDYAAKARSFADQRQLLLSGGWGAAMEVACWLCGIENLMYLTFDQPDFVQELAGMLSAWNRSRMEVMLDAGVDLFVRRGWYENASFWSPETYRKFILPDLCRDAEIVHQAGAKFAYILTTSSTPLLGMLMEAGVDVLVGVDPVQGMGTDLAETKRLTAGRMCLWGGVNGFVTVERGTPKQVRNAVSQAIRILAPGGGFILSPVDNVRDPSEKAWKNVLTLIEAWKERRDYPIGV
jgi:hypothetical protein